MRFACESCQTRYVVSDDRIRGRTLKVRCKKCGNLILLKAAPETQDEAPEVVARAPAPAREQAEEATQMVDSARLGAARGQSVRQGETTDPAAAQEESEWHVILPAGQQGPLPLSALIQKMVAGEMLPRSFVWRDGMPDWARAQEVPEVARWLPAARPQSKTSASSGPAESSKPPPQAPAGEAAGPERHEEAAQDFFEDGEKGVHPGLVHTPLPDALARVRSAPEFASAKPGELTKFFITQAHVSKGRSPWVVIAFGVGAAVLLVGGVIGLSELGVPVPLVAESPTHQPKIFTGPQGDSRVRDLLYGRPKAAGGGQGSSNRRAVPGGGPSELGAPQGPLATRAEQHVDQLGKSDKDQLSRLYATQDLSNLKLKPTASALPVLDRADAPLTPEQVSRTIAKFQTGYTRCIDGELKRNPNFQGGKIRIVTTIMSSGLVRQAQIVSDDQRLQRSVAGGQLGSCLSEQTRRMVFPSFQGEPFDAEIPLVLSSAL